MKTSNGHSSRKKLKFRYLIAPACVSLLVVSNNTNKLTQCYNSDYVMLKNVIQYTKTPNPFEDCGYRVFAHSFLLVLYHSLDST